MLECKCANLVHAGLFVSLAAFVKVNAPCLFLQYKKDPRTGQWYGLFGVFDGEFKGCSAKIRYTDKRALRITAEKVS